MHVRHRRTFRVSQCLPNNKYLHILTNLPDFFFTVYSLQGDSQSISRRHNALCTFGVRWSKLILFLNQHVWKAEEI